MEGTIFKSTGSWFEVAADNGRQYACRLKGKLRMKGLKSTNPVAVGDRVKFELEEKHETGLITTIIPRKNYIIRKATKLSKVSHILAANLDQVCIMATLAFPRTSSGFIDRLLVTAEAYHIPAAIVFNKIDLHGDKHQEQLQSFIEIYKAAGYPCLQVSALTGENIDSVKNLLKNKVSLITGHSGVGKSAMINAIQPGLELKTAELSDAHQKGTHTTTFAEMFKLDFGGFIVDSPGIKEFGLIDFSRKEIAERFPEMRRYMHDCRFSNCTHTHEPGCAVLEAIEKGEIALSRYQNYLGILNDDYWEKTENDFR